MQTAVNIGHQATPRQRRKVPQSLDAINHPGAHLRLEVVLALTGLSRSQWHRLVQEGKAKPALKFGPRCSRYLASDITQFLADRTAQGAKQ